MSRGMAPSICPGVQDTRRRPISALAGTERGARAIEGPHARGSRRSSSRLAHGRSRALPAGRRQQLRDCRAGHAQPDLPQDRVARPPSRHGLHSGPLAAFSLASQRESIGQVLCLGLSLPAGIRVTDLVILAYGALSMQTIQLDEGDSAGVLNPAAAAWWQLNRRLIPLSRDSFIPSCRRGSS